MYQIQQEIQEESEALLKAILEYEAAHKHEPDFVDTIYEYFHWKIEELLTISKSTGTMVFLHFMSSAS